MQKYSLHAVDNSRVFTDPETLVTGSILAEVDGKEAKVRKKPQLCLALSDEEVVVPGGVYMTLPGRQRTLFKRTKKCRLAKFPGGRLSPSFPPLSLSLGVSK